MAEFDPFAAQFFFDHDFVASANVARRELGRQGLDAFRQTKMVIIDHGPSSTDGGILTTTAFSIPMRNEGRSCAGPARGPLIACRD